MKSEKHVHFTASNQPSVDFELNSKLFEEHVSRYWWASLNFATNKKVLDCACGKGYGTYVLAKSAERAVGADLNADSISYANRQFKADNLTYFTHDATKIAELEGQFDLITAFEIIEHIAKEDVGSFIQGLRGSLNKRGKLLISTPNHDVVLKSGSIIPQYHINNYRPAELKRFLLEHFPEVKMLGQFKARQGLKQIVFDFDYFNLRHHFNFKKQSTLSKSSQNIVPCPDGYFETPDSYVRDYFFSPSHWRQAGITLAICQND